MRSVLANKDMMRRLNILVGNSINRNWPENDIGKTITIQMDNASPHLTEDDPAWIEARKDWRFDIQLMRQPAQSPDTNVLDLGLWTSLQSIQRKLPMMSASSTEMQLVEAVQQAWINMPLTTIESSFVTLQNVLREIRANDGGNHFKTPRKRKYAQLIEAGDYSIATTYESDDDTITEAECDSDIDIEAKPAALREPNLVGKFDGVLGA